MPHVRVKGVSNTLNFPDDMDITDIREVLRRKFTQDIMSGRSDILEPQPQTIEATQPTLAERAGQGVSDFLFDKGIISDRHGAQRIGSNLSALGEFLPVIGDATAGDEFGRALAKGDKTGIALSALGVIPVAGDVLKKAFTGSNPVNTFDTIRNRFKRDSKIVDLPQGKVGSDEFERIKEIDPKAKVTGRNADGTIKIEFLEEFKPKKLGANLFEFDPDALEITENTLKRTDNFKGDITKPVAVTKSEGDFFILDGHHRVKLAKEQGRNINAIVIPEADVKKMRKQGLNQADMLEEWTKTNQPTKTKDLLKNKFPDLKIGIRESADNIILDKIVVPDKSKGTGTKFMKELISDADNKGKVIGLTPSSDFGGNKKRLTEFYKRFGFVDNKGKNKDFTISESMIRVPKK